MAAGGRSSQSGPRARCFRPSEGHKAGGDRSHRRWRPWSLTRGRSTGSAGRTRARRGAVWSRSLRSSRDTGTGDSGASGHSRQTRRSHDRRCRGTAAADTRSSRRSRRSKASCDRGGGHCAGGGARCALRRLSGQPHCRLRTGTSPSRWPARASMAGPSYRALARGPQSREPRQRPLQPSVAAWSSIPGYQRRPLSKPPMQPGDRPGPRCRKAVPAPSAQGARL